jgi:hypothetical protein
LKLVTDREPKGSPVEYPTDTSMQVGAVGGAP